MASDGVQAWQDDESPSPLARGAVQGGNPAVVEFDRTLLQRPARVIATDGSLDKLGDCLTRAVSSGHLAKEVPEARRDPEDDGSSNTDGDCSDEAERLSFHQFLGTQLLARFENLTLACTRVSRLDVRLVTLQRYFQEWRHDSTIVGAPVSHIALAPLEVRTVRVAHKRKTTLSRSDTARRSARLTFDSASSTKASQSATSSSVARNNWSVSATGSYGIPDVVGGGLTAESGGSSEFTKQRSVSYVGEETLRSSRQIQVDTETTTKTGLETSFEHVEDHTLRNPYADRPLDLTIRQLFNCHRVRTYSGEARPCLVLDFDPIDLGRRRLRPSLVFDDSFVQLHAHFVRTCLADDQLAYTIDLYGDDEGPAVSWEELTKNAERCLAFMYRDKHVFAPQGAQIIVTNSQVPLDPTLDIDRSFDVTVFPRSGFNDAVDNDITEVYVLLASVKYLWERDIAQVLAEVLSTVDYSRRVIEYVKILVDGSEPWRALSEDDKRKLHDFRDSTELFRRIPAFLGLAKETVLDPLGHTPPSTRADDAPPEEGEQPSPVVSGEPTSRPDGVVGITNHLNCMGRHYTEEYLHFLHRVTGVSSIEELVAAAPAELRQFHPILSFSESFIDGTTWVVPFVQTLDESTVKECLGAKPTPAGKPFERTDLVRLPADGVTIEATAPTSGLDGLPTSSNGWNAFLPVQLAEPHDAEPSEDG